MKIIARLQGLYALPRPWVYHVLSSGLLYLFIFIGFPGNSTAQGPVLLRDSIIMVDLDEVILISARKALDHQRQPKPLSSLDEYLESSRKVDMVKRGAYAWEPTLNNMFSERLSLTID